MDIGIFGRSLNPWWRANNYLSMLLLFIQADDVAGRRRFASPESSHLILYYQHRWWGQRPSVLRQDRSETKKKVLVFVLVCTLCSWPCRSDVVLRSHGLVTLVVIMILKDTATFQVLFIVSLFPAWNIATICWSTVAFIYLKVKFVECFLCSTL